MRFALYIFLNLSDNNLMSLQSMFSYTQFDFTAQFRSAFVYENKNFQD